MLYRAASLMLLASLAAAAPGTSSVPAGTEIPPQLKEVGIDQKLNAQVPMDAQFADAKGNKVTVGQLLGKRPAILALVYYECPMLCTMILNGMLRTLRAENKLTVGKDFDVIAISFDPSETPQLAEKKKFEYTERYHRPGSEDGWHFLTGDQANIRRVTDAVGYRYQRDEKTGNWSHASAIMVLTPEGRLSKYFYGVEYSVRDLRLGLVDAGQGKIGSVVEQVLLFCFHYDVTTGKYSLVIMNIMRAGGVLTVLGILAFWLTQFRHNRRRKYEHVEFSSIS
jgi:protein SCO1/2